MQASQNPFPWHSGYEFDFPNELDRSFQDRFCLAHRDIPGMFIGRSPWCADDLEQLEFQTPRRPITMTANLGLLFYGSAQYCYAGMDEPFIRRVIISEHPKTIFIAGGSERACEMKKRLKYPNLWLHTDPPEAPAYLQTLGDRRLPRPWRMPVSGLRAVWFLHYCGCNPIYLCGVDYKARDGVYYGDTKERLPEGALVEENKMWFGLCAELVNAIRSCGTTVVWPGEIRNG